MNLRLLVAVIALVHVTGPALAEREVANTPQKPVPVMATGNEVLVSHGSGALHARETAGPDTFVLYGGPDNGPEGKFQLADGLTPDWGGGNGLPGGYGGGASAWTPVDRTLADMFWHVDTFNAENLNNNGPGNLAMWCGLPASDPRTAGWANPPGYGNSWFDRLDYASEPLVDPSISQTVSLDFYFNYGLLDETWDWFFVQYDSAGVWTTVYEATGTSYAMINEYLPPGVQYSAEQTRPIYYAGNDYGGENGDQIRIRFLVTSDGAWSNADVLPSVSGAVQVDDITLTTSQGTWQEGFEGTAPYLFNPAPGDHAGDFADLYLLGDIDPCRDNPTPAAGFIDFGQTVRNGPNEFGIGSTGGATDPGISYGITGSFVVNNDAGISIEDRQLDNEIWSPEILWDRPGGDDDDPAISGANLRFDVWRHLPLANGIFYTWYVRSALPGEGFKSWQSRQYVYFGGLTTNAGTTWLQHQEDITDLIQEGAERIQISLGCKDLSEVFGLPADGSTPSPVFDNVTLRKYRLDGPVLTARAIDLAQDGFPVGGGYSVESPAARDALDVPFSMARDINSASMVNVPGDSIVVDAHAMIPGTTITDLRMIWALSTNAFFEDALRAAPARPVDQNVTAGAAGTVWTGEVDASQSYTNGVFLIPGRFFFDLPDADFMYPGDVLHYYFEATDSGGRVSRLPRDTTGFGDFGPDSPYNRSFRVRALPSYDGPTPDAQPGLLVYNATGLDGGPWLDALRELGCREGIEFDTYTMKGPTSFVSNTIGTANAHGATVDQLLGYNRILHLAGRLDTRLLASGDASLDTGNKGDDVGLLTGWLATEGERCIVHFGDAIASGNQQYVESESYVQNILGVDFHGADVRGDIQGQDAPAVIPNSAGTWTGVLTSEFTAYGGCFTLNTFDHITPRGFAEAGHWFTTAGGIPVTGPGVGVASVLRAHDNGYAATFPYGSASVTGPGAGGPETTALTTLLREVLIDLFGQIKTPTSAPAHRPVTLAAHPNPFNPATTIEFRTPPGSKGSIRVYSVRGELVRTVHEGEYQTDRFTWDGTDDRGRGVASGIYLIRASGNDQVRRIKVALVK